MSDKPSYQTTQPQSSSDGREIFVTFREFGDLTNLDFPAQVLIILTLLGFVEQYFFPAC
jgi:hypothetical protein